MVFEMESGLGLIPTLVPIHILYTKVLGILKTKKNSILFVSNAIKKSKLDIFQKGFGEKLLPWMYSMPIHAVPKLHSTNLQLITNHSAGEYYLNSMIIREVILLTT